MTHKPSIHPNAQNTRPDLQHCSDWGKLVWVSCKGSVVCLWAAFTIEGPFFVHWEPLLPAGNFTACGPGMFPLTPQAPWFVFTGVESTQV
jgi:hypothetical protein